MCFHVSQAHKTPITVNFHVLCWKAGSLYHYDYKEEPVGVSSLYRSEPYRFGKLKKTDRFTFDNLCYSSIGETNRLINRGLHSYSVPPPTRGLGHGRFPALIPAGTPFYFNERRRELVSLQLIVFRDIETLQLHASVTGFETVARKL